MFREEKILSVPESRMENGNNGENFQTPGEHQERKDPLGDVAGLTEVAEVVAESGTDVAHGRYGRTDCGNEVHTVKCEEDDAAENQQEIEKSKGEYLTDQLSCDDNPIDSYRYHQIGVGTLLKFVTQVFHQDDEATDFDSSRRRSGTAADNHHHDSYTPEERPPREVIGRGIAGGTDDRIGLKESMTEIFLQARIFPPIQKP